jgi:RNA polymerase sigma-70 factor (ECF subfamily)
VRQADDDVFAAERPRLLGLAYRVLGSIAEAEDVVQDAWLRWAAADRGSVERPAAYLTTVVTRLSLDRIRAIGRRREAYPGPWLPEPVALERGLDEHAEMAESLTLGFLVLLDRLNPVERAVFLLADVFGEPYSVIADSVGRTEGACRQVAARARRRLREERPPPTERLDAEALARLLFAVSLGDLEQTLALLDADVVLLSDGGPDHRAARRPVVGAHRVARFVLNLAKRFPASDARLTELNGEPALVADADGIPLVVTAEQSAGRITRIYLLRNPDKLHAVEGRPARMA